MNTASTGCCGCVTVAHPHYWQPREKQIEAHERYLDKAIFKGGTDYRWDDALPGFGVRIYQTGRKYFLVTYRQNGRKRFLSVGRYGVLSLDQARENGRELLAAATLGEDPSAE